MIFIITRTPCKNIENDEIDAISDNITDELGAQRLQITSQRRYMAVARERKADLKPWMPRGAVNRRIVLDWLGRADGYNCKKKI